MTQEVKFVIEVNNNKSKHFYFDKTRNLLVIETYFKGECLKTDTVTAGDFITLLNWYQWQKENGNKNLMF